MQGGVKGSMVGGIKGAFDPVRQTQHKGHESGAHIRVTGGGHDRREGVEDREALGSAAVSVAAILVAANGR